MNLYELAVALTLDKKDFENGVKGTETQVNSLGSKVGSVMSTTAKVIGAGVVAGATAVTALVKSSVEAYANYEQLVGGVETLFGEISKTGDASAQVIKDAGEAYKFAGLSANEYMETATSFSASLMASLGNDAQKASEITKRTVTDMADNANKMGTSMESIQNAYQGFAKQNYTMLDNLKLGYGGTKEEMQRLLADATKLTGVKYDISNLSDVYTAIGVIQDSLGITGTTAKEAMATISGSLNMTKSAWENLITGMADDNADFGALINNLVESVTAFAGNVIPRVGQALNGVGQLVEQLAPKIVEALPNLVSTVLPSLLQSALGLFQQTVTALVSALPVLVDVGLKAIITFANGLTESLPTMIPQIVGVITQIVEVLLDNLPALIEASLYLIMAIANGLIEALPVLIEKLPKIIEGIVRTLIQLAPQLVQASFTLIWTLVSGLITYIPYLVAQIPKIITAIVKGLTAGLKDIVKVGKNLIEGLWEGIKDRTEWLLGKVMGFAENIIKAVKKVFGVHSPSKEFAWIGEMCAEGFEEGIEDLADGTITDKALGTIKNSLGDFEISVAGRSAGSVLNQTINVNQEISTADELARAVRLESRYGLMKGVALGY